MDGLDGMEGRGEWTPSVIDTLHNSLLLQYKILEKLVTFIMVLI